MDTSKKYIKMCEKAEEIQEKFNWYKGDYYAHQSSIYLWGNGKEIWVAYNLGETKGVRYIWLPRQDQLQEMVARNNNYQLLTDFYNWCDENFYQWLDKKLVQNLGQLSMEQLWLAFVIKEKYNKIWNGKDWNSV